MRINYERLVHSIYHHYLSILIVATILSGFSGYFASKLISNIKTDFADLLPDDYMSVRELNRIKERVGGIGPLMVLITSDDLDKAVNFMHVLADSLKSSPLISSLSIYDSKKEILKKNKLLYMDIEDLTLIRKRLDAHVELEKLKRSPLYFSFEEEDTTLDFSDIQSKYEEKSDSKSKVDQRFSQYILTKEKNGVILKLYPAGVITDVEFSQQLLQYLDRTIDTINPTNYHPSLRYSYKGPFKNSANQITIIMQDLRSTAVYSILGVLLLISFYFRQVFASIFITIPLLMGLAWTFGITYFVIGSLNMITVGLFAILFGLGIDFGIHIFARYREARRRGTDVLEALSETVVHTGSALTTTAITTAIAFYSLMLTDFKGFSEFGFIVGTGILFSLVTMVLICPAFIMLADRLNIIKLSTHQTPDYLLRLGKYPLPLATILVGTLIASYSVYHLTEIDFEYDFSKLKPRPLIKQDQASLPESLKESRSPAIILTENYTDAMEVVETLKSIKQANGDSSTIKSIKSVYSVLPKQQKEKLEIVNKIRSILNSNESLFDKDQQSKVDSLRPYLNVERLSLYDLPDDLTNEFKSKTGEILSFVAINAAVQLKDGRNAIKFANEIREIRTPSDKVYYASSSHIIIAEMLNVMLRDSKIAVVLTLFVITAVLMIDLRSLADTLLVLTPLLTALVWITGVMYVFEIKLNLYNMVAFPTVIGMGIDNGVHVFHRYKEIGKGSLRLVLRTTGYALLATSLTTMVGFSGLVPAHHPALTSIGILSLIGLGCCFVTSVTILPALLQIREDREKSN